MWSCMKQGVRGTKKMFLNLKRGPSRVAFPLANIDPACSYALISIIRDSMQHRRPSETVKGENKQQHPHCPRTPTEPSGQNALLTQAAECKMASNTLRVQTERWLKMFMAFRARLGHRRAPGKP